MGTAFKKVAGRTKVDEVVAERKPFRVWYVVNPCGNLAVRRNFKGKSR